MATLDQALAYDQVLTNDGYGIPMLVNIDTANPSGGIIQGLDGSWLPDGKWQVFVDQSRRYVYIFNFTTSELYWVALFSTQASRPTMTEFDANGKATIIVESLGSDGHSYIWMGDVYVNGASANWHCIMTNAWDGYVSETGTWVAFAGMVDNGTGTLMCQVITAHLNSMGTVDSFAQLTNSNNPDHPEADHPAICKPYGVTSPGSAWTFWVEPVLVCRTGSLTMATGVNPSDPSTWKKSDIAIIRLNQYGSQQIAAGRTQQGVGEPGPYKMVFNPAFCPDPPALVDAQNNFEMAVLYDYTTSPDNGVTNYTGSRVFGASDNPANIAGNQQVVNSTGHPCYLGTGARRVRRDPTRPGGVSYA